MKKILKFDVPKEIIIPFVLMDTFIGGIIVFFLFFTKTLTNLDNLWFWVVLIVFLPTAVTIIFASKFFARGEIIVDGSRFIVNWKNKMNYEFNLDRATVEKWQAVWTVHETDRKVLVYKIEDGENTFSFFIEISWFKKNYLPEKPIEGEYVQVRDKTVFGLHPKFQIQ